VAFWSTPVTPRRYAPGGPLSINAARGKVPVRVREMSKFCRRAREGNDRGRGWLWSGCRASNAR